MKKGINHKNLNTKVEPQNDFFEYAVGGWNKRHPMPADKSVWGTFHVLRENSKDQLKEVIGPLTKNRKIKKGSKEQQVRDLYLAAMDESAREKLGLSPLKPVLARIDAIKTKKDLLEFFAWGHRMGLGVMWGMYVNRDAKKSDKNALMFSQGGLSLPDRDYYLNDDAESKRVRAEFEKYVLRLLALVGYKKHEAVRMQKLVMAIETDLAKDSMTRVELRDPNAQYNKRTLTTLKKDAPHIDWGVYLSLTKVPAPKDFIVLQPKFMARASKLFNEIPVEDWKAYLRFGAIDDMAPLLTRKLVAESFRFYSTILSGTKKMQPLWKRAVGVVDGILGDALGELYIKKFFSQKAKRQIDALVDNLFAAYHERLSKLEWMSAATKKKAFIKLRSIKRKLGYPTKWESYTGLIVDPRDYVGNLFRSHEYEFDRMIGKLKKKPDPTEWYMTPPTVNAYYDPNANEIAFPAGIMQPPFFDENADDALNYGAIGTVIGHEITHGFDDEGRQYDHKGNLKDWWTKEDKKRFEKRAKVLADQFDTFEAIDGMHVNGKLTLGENIADLGGIIIAFEAYQKSQKGKKREMIGGFTPEQRFFLGYATTEAGTIRPELLKKYLVIDPHAPSKFRVNGPLSNMASFYEAFGVEKGHTHYRDKKLRAQIW
ncbi:MAG: M13 family metallopeptidase [Patescibacteria group bacterium]